MVQTTQSNGFFEQDASAREKLDAVNACKRRFLRQDMTAALIMFALLVLVPAMPFVKGWMVSQASLVIIFVIAGMGISILVGYTGLVSVGHGGFLAIGAYTSALLTKYFAVDLVVGIVAATLVSAVIGALLALVFLRLSGAFMAIGTLGFAFFVGTVVNNVPIFEGRDGILLDDNVVLGMQIGDFGFYYVSIVTLALVTLFVYCVVNSGTGRAFMALRDSEKAAMSSGVNRLLYRTLAFSISAGITGSAGALNAHIVNYVSAEVYADIWFSVDILMAVVVGGPALLFGPYLGGAFVVMLPFFLEQLADFAFILKGVVLILVLRFAQQGVGEVMFRPIKNMRRRRLQEAGGARVD